MSNIFLGKIVDMNLYLKSIREKSTAKTKIHVGTNEPEDKANNILQLVKSLETNTNKAAVSSILLTHLFY